ncbi:hypothetical protein D3C73_1274580 [compost metagenome]
MRGSRLGDGRQSEQPQQPVGQAVHDPDQWIHQPAKGCHKPRRQQQDVLRFVHGNGLGRDLAEYDVQNGDQQERKDYGAYMHRRLPKAEPRQSRSQQGSDYRLSEPSKRQ